MPERIQRQRTKGWRMPEGAVGELRLACRGRGAVRVMTRQHAVELYRECAHYTVRKGPAIKELRGKDLACWCPLDEPCHADVLLEWANREVAP